MRTPTIHLNGTSGGELLDKNSKALDAVQAAIEALCAAAPHGRDYYVQGASATTEVLREHNARLEKLMAVREELRTIVEAILDQE